MSGERRAFWWPEVGVWAALALLMAVSFGSAYIPMGAFNAVTNMTIAAVKAALVALFFMHLLRPRTMMRFAAVAGLLWLAILFSLTFSDYLARGWAP